MSNVRPELEVYEEKEEQLVGYQKIGCHMVFNIKMEDNFRRKARLVAGVIRPTLPHASPNHQWYHLIQLVYHLPFPN